MKVMAVAADGGRRLARELEKEGIAVALYSSLFKAMDNVEEIAPDFFLLKHEDFPHHWKLVAQYLKSSLFKSCRFILWKERNAQEFSYQDAAFLHVITAESYEEILKSLVIKREECDGNKPSLLRRIERLSLR